MLFFCFAPTEVRLKNMEVVCETWLFIKDIIAAINLPQRWHFKSQVRL